MHSMPAVYSELKSNTPQNINAAVALLLTPYSLLHLEMVRVCVRACGHVCVWGRLGSDEEHFGEAIVLCPPDKEGAWPN